MVADNLIEMGRQWRDANPALARRMLGPASVHGGGGVGKHGQVLNIPNDPRRREQWETWEDDLIADHSIPLSTLAARLGRSKVAITTRRWAMRQEARR